MEAGVRLQLAAAIAVILFLTCTARADIDTGDMTTADKCKALRQLSAMYSGASLTAEERAVKAQMVAWYRVNCRRHR